MKLGEKATSTAIVLGASVRTVLCVRAVGRIFH